MDDLVRLIDTLGGLAATHELHRAGYSRAQIAAAVRMRRILRVRQGWYARPDADRTLLAAARVGGPVTCTSGLKRQGIWVARFNGLHVASNAHDARLRSKQDSRIRLPAHEDVRVHWRSLPAGGSRLILSPVECLRDALHCLNPIEFAQSADSLLRVHPGLRTQWLQLRDATPARVRPFVQSVDGVCESGIETRIWLYLLRLTSEVKRQVVIKPAGRVDFLVGDRLVIEADGEEYHSNELQFEEDRRRDAALASLGYIVLRFSYRQVMERWPEVEQAITAALPLANYRSTY